MMYLPFSDASAFFPAMYKAAGNTANAVENEEMVRVAMV
jgi:hypothetical protein